MKGFPIQGSDEKALEVILSLKSRLYLLKDFHIQGSNEKVTYCISSIIRQIFFSFQNNPKDLDPLGLFRKGKIGIISKFHRTDLVI